MVTLGMVSQTPAARVETRRPDPETQKLSREAFQTYKRLTSLLPPPTMDKEFRKLKEGRSKEMLQLLGVNLAKLQELDKKYAARDLNAAKKMREAYRQAPQSDLVKYKAAKANFYAQSSQVERARILLPGSILGFDTVLTGADDGSQQPDNQVLTTTEVGNFDIIAKGEDDGWEPGDCHETDGGTCFTFNFVPWATTFYTFSAFVHYVGQYIMFSDDSALTSKKVWWEICQVTSIGQSVPNESFSRYFDEQKLWSMENDNICVQQGFDDGSSISGQVLLYQGIPVTVLIQVMATVRAKGEGSVSELDFGKGGEGIFCPALTVSI